MIHKTLSLLMLALGLCTAAEAGSIKKCQDSEGRWHYGDRAAELCDQSKIIEMSGSGTKTGEIAAPPTEGELAERERQRVEAKRQRKLEEEQARRDALLLSTYGHENDILYVRDRKLEQTESSISASKETLKSLRATLERLEKQAAQEQRGGHAVPEDTGTNIERSKAQIERHEAAIAAKRQEQENLKVQYEAELKRYRELKQKQAKRGR